MIDFIKGEVLLIEEDYIVVEVQGIGYRIFCPNPFQFTLHSQVTMYTHHHVREDAMHLFGFSSREEQKLFRKLLDVNGVGPRVAVGILAAGNPHSFTTAIQQENITVLTKLPGIGKKTAQRLILDLKGKLPEVAMDSTDTNISSMSTVADTSLSFETKEALQSLGISRDEADMIWQKIEHQVTADDSVDAVLKLALKQLHQG
ncbi:Holliday junction branch migration protein RuvA [Longirhabdus pacifica]|uniref:Holliday junction branch migration protein RuvA n=1 Tax=Longirhabdus pacifica TaxID=2305227 RepID=UPI001008E2C6|nr:Holliday junction branch migration protein RuvA [Longirhabdus pacifica]